MEIEDFSLSAEEYNDDDVSTQAGTTLASHSVAADEQRNEALDEDSEVSDSESMPDHGAIGKTLRGALVPADSRLASAHIRAVGSIGR